MYSVPALPIPVVLADPCAFFASPEGKDWIGKLADNFPHTRYWRERSDCWSLKSLNCRATIKIRIRDNQDQKVFSGR